MIGFFRTFICLILMMLLPVFVFCQDPVKIISVQVIPQKIIPGDKFTVDITIINTSRVEWQPGEYGFYIGIFQNDKLIFKSKYITARKKLPAGATRNFRITGVNIPQNFSGSYDVYVKVKLKDRTFSSDKPVLLTVVAPVSETSVDERTPDISRVPVLLNGSVYIPYQSEVAKNINPFGFNADISASRGNISSSLHMKMGQGWKQFTLDFKSPVIDSGVGDITPNFGKNEFVLSGIRARGLYALGKFEKFNIYALGLQTAEALESDNGTAGTYQRLMYGGRLEGKPYTNTIIGLNFAKSYDRKSSISNTGGTLPIDNQVYGVDVSVLVTKWMTGNLEYASSLYDTNVDDGTKPKNQQTYRLKAEANFNWIGFGAKYFYSDPDFFSLGSPGTLPDRKGFNFNTFYQNSPFFISADFLQSRDNVNNRANTITTTGNTLSLNGNITPKDWPSFNVNCSFSANKGSTKSLINNNTKSFGVGTSYPFTQALTASLNYSLSMFIDETKLANDLNIHTITSNLSGQFSKRFSCYIGVSRSETKDLRLSASKISLNPSLGFTWALNPSNFEISGSFSSSRYKDESDLSDNNTTSARLNGDIFLSEMASISFGAENRVYKNTKESSLNNTDFVFYAGFMMKFSKKL